MAADDAADRRDVDDRAAAGTLMAGTAALVPRNTPVELISITQFQCSSVWSASRGPAVWPVWMLSLGSRPEMPAMLHRMSTRPQVFSA